MLYIALSLNLLKLFCIILRIVVVMLESFILRLFPIRESGMNVQAQELQKHEALVKCFHTGIEPSVLLCRVYSFGFALPD